MINSFEFTMPAFITDEELGGLKKWESKRSKGVSLQLLSNSRHRFEHDRSMTCFIKKQPQLRTLKVSVSVPILLYGDLFRNVKSEDLPLVLPMLSMAIHDTLNIPNGRIPDIRTCTVDRITVGESIYIGNKEHYMTQQDIPINILSYKSPSKWVYRNVRLCPRDQDYISFDCYQGKQIVSTTKCKSQIDHVPIIELEEGILLLRFDATHKQITEHSREKFLGELLNPAFATKVIEGWASMPQLRVPYFSSLSEVKQHIFDSNLSWPSQCHLISFLETLIADGSIKCRKRYKPASFISYYSKLRKVLGVDAIVLTEHNTENRFFLERYKKDHHSPSQRLASSGN